MAIHPKKRIARVRVPGRQEQPQRHLVKIAQHPGAMAITIEDVRYIASLARLQFDEQEERVLAKQMDDILGYMETLRELDTSDVEPMTHVLELSNVFRDDEVEKRMSVNEALRNAPDADGTYFRVPKVIG